jgi:hypothetical protein
MGSVKSSAAQSVVLSRDTSERAPVPSRIVKAIDDVHLVRLTGNTHPLAQQRYDQGPLALNVQLEKMMLVLQRSPEQEQELEAFSARQYDPSSADFHHWLHADEFGSRFGPSEADMTVIENWLQGLGFTINEVAKGRTWIQFSGNVSLVQNAFHVEMHRYVVNGEEHIANDRDPQIPEALSPVVVGIASLHNFFPKPQLVRGKLVKRDRATGKITPLDSQPAPASGQIPDDLMKRSGAGSGSSPAPQLTYTDGNDHVHEDLTPYDFATIYNYLPLWNASKTGTGVAVAIAAGSDIDVADLTNFRKTFGLPATTLNVIHNGTDPGQSGSNGDQSENTLDVEMVSASAPGATIDLVVSGNTSTTGGFELSDAYIVDNEVAPIMSASYGSCELELGTANNAAFNKIWQQGATEGISIFESSGDQGSAGCTRTDGLTPPQADQIGLQVNGMASSPYVTAVGGTDFTWSFINEPISTYWNASNNADLATAKGYLPEVPWNSTCSNPLLLNIFPGEATSEQLCNDALNSSNFPGLVNVIAGSGGYSHCTTPSGTTGATCSGGYAKPTWQTGSGVPTDGKRDLPDVSLFASGGFPDELNGSAILFCESSSSPEGTCDYTNPSYIIYQEIGGTSASSPLLAGIMALVVQKTGSAQGLANPVFYQLAAKQVAAGTNCDSSTDTNASTCVFHDISQGTISQVCVTGDPNCVTNTGGDELGLLSGYAAAKGYDEAIGLGSVNVNNLVSKWTSTAGTPAITLSPTSATFPSTTVGTTSTTTETFTAKNTGTAAVTFSNIEITGTNYTSYTGSSTCSTTTALAVGASCTVTVSFKPTAAGTLTATLDVIDNAGTQTASLSGTGTAATTTLSLSPTSLTFASTVVGNTTAAQVVTIKNTGTNAVTLTSETITGTNATSFLKSATTCGTSLAAAASCTVSVEFKPAAAGSLTGALSIADNATGSPQTVALTGNGVAATMTLSLSPASLTFASTVVGSTTAAQVVTIKNTGTAAVTLTSETITGTNASSFVKSATTCGTSLAASATCTVSVEFKPTVAGSLTGTLSIADNATGSPQTVALKGTATASTTPIVTLSTTSLTFASTNVGIATNEQTVTLTNTGSVPVSITAVALGGTNPTSFEELTNCGSTLAASASCAFYVAFKPAAAGSLTATVSVTDNATGSPQKVTLAGTGVAAPTLKLSATTIAFPTTKSGSTSAAQAVTLTNSGTTTIDLNSISLAGATPASFEELTNCGAALAANASCTVYIAFKPTAAGSVTAALSLFDNAASSPQTVALSGTGD